MFYSSALIPEPVCLGAPTAVLSLSKQQILSIPQPVHGWFDEGPVGRMEPWGLGSGRHVGNPNVLSHVALE